MTDSTELAMLRRAAPRFGLFADKIADHPPLARATDPSTSHDGAEDVRPRLKGQKARILAAYVGYGPMTAEEVGRVVGFNAWRRTSDLLNEGRLRRTGETRTNASGSTADVLEATP